MHSKILTKIIHIFIVIIILLEFVYGNLSYAAYNIEEVEQPNNTVGESLDKWTGMILEPVVEFATFVADCIFSIVSTFMTGTSFESIMQESLPETSEGITAGAKITLSTDQYKNAFGDIINVKYPHIKYSPEEIFSGQIDLLSIDFISGEVMDSEGNVISNSSEGWNALRVVVASWYKTLRMMAIVALLSILIYTGIKMMLSTNANNKAKYKTMIVNWFVAIILLFTMHYIMAFIIAIIQNITILLKNTMGNIEVHFNGKEFVTNLMGLARFQMQQQAFSKKVAQLCIYVALITLTIKFSVRYIKRMINMAFLTLISPIIACTYPLNKMNGENSSEFKTWLMEYIYNALLQIVHLILYIVLMDSAFSLSVRNPIYAIAVLMFMNNAEKIFMKIFGFQRAKGGMVKGAMEAVIATDIVKDVTKSFSRMTGGRMASKQLAGKSDNSEQRYEEDDEDPDINEDFKMKNWIEGSDDIDQFSDNLNPQPAQNSPQSPQSPQRRISSNDDIDDLRDRYSESDSPEEHQRKLPIDMGSILAMLQNRNNKLKDPNISDKKREKLENDILQNKRALKARIEMSEERLRKAGIQLRYKDTHSELSTERLLDLMFKAVGTGGIDTARYYANTINNRIGENEFIANQLLRPTTQNRSSEDDIKDIPIIGGIKNVAKQIVKPVWDVEKSSRYNGERLAKNFAKIIIGTTAGVTVAAVEAGTSITDGKYTPFETATSFAAGYAGANAVVNKAGRSVYSNVRQYTGNASVRLDNKCEEWFNRDDVIKYYNQKFHGRAKTMRERARDNYVTRGITDFEEQEKCFKYADYLLKNNRVKSVAQADKIAISTMHCRKQLISDGNYAVMYDDAKREKYLDRQANKYSGTGKEEKARNVYDRFLNNIKEFEQVND